MFATIPSYLKPHLQHRLLNAVEERLLIAASQSGDRRARERLLHFNLRLLVAMAKAFFEGFPHLDWDDLFDACFVGLNHAIDDFDMTRNVRLITFARWKIRDEMQAVARKVDRDNRYFSLQSVEELEIDSQCQPFDQLERQEYLATLKQKRREIWKALQGIPKVCRKIIVLRLFGHKWNELGIRFGFSATTAANRFKQYFPVVQGLLVPAKVITPPRRSLRRVLTRRTPRLRLATAAVRPTRSRPSDRTAQARPWPRVRHRIAPISRPGVGNAVERLKRSPLASQKQAELRLLPLPISSAIRSLVDRLIGRNKRLDFQEQMHTPARVAPVSSSQRTIRGSPERSPP